MIERKSRTADALAGERRVERAASSFAAATGAGASDAHERGACW